LLNIISSISEIHSFISAVRSQNKSIALVPTMGYLHEGHLALVKRAKEVCDVVVVSIFVNPTQFAPHEDFARYPRDIDRDTTLARNAGCDLLFIPNTNDIYPKGFSTYVTVEELSSVLEGEFRPSHFKGVTTIVNKLLNIVQADKVFFGQKDAQQCAVIKKMVRDLNIPTQIEIVPTVREEDGLAMSSRNMYLSAEERNNAPVLYRSLQFAEKKIRTGERVSAKLIEEMTAMILSKHPTKIDYIAIVDAETLELKQMLTQGDTVLIPLAVRFGSTRLIDNIILTV